MPMRGKGTGLMPKVYGLTTAELFCRSPDWRNGINSVVWQDRNPVPD
jgi:uncharacterized protein Usg